VCIGFCVRPGTRLDRLVATLAYTGLLIFHGGFDQPLSPIITISRYLLHTSWLIRLCRLSRAVALRLSWTRNCSVKTEDVGRLARLRSVALKLTCNSYLRTILRTHSHVAWIANMLLAMSSNILGILRHFCDIQQHRRMAECRGPNITNLHAAELHCAANTEDTESLPLSMSHHRGHDDLSRVYHPFGSEPRAMLRRDHAK
jgi:hypothetical protein